MLHQLHPKVGAGNPFFQTGRVCMDVEKEEDNTSARRVGTPGNNMPKFQYGKLPRYGNCHTAVIRRLRDKTVELCQPL